MNSIKSERKPFEKEGENKPCNALYNLVTALPRVALFIMGCKMSTQAKHLYQHKKKPVQKYYQIYNIT